MELSASSSVIFLRPNNHFSTLFSDTTNTFFLSVAQQPNSGIGRLFVWFLDHTQLDPHTQTLQDSSERVISFGAENATYTTRNTNKRTSMNSAGFQTAIPAIGRPY
jgi:hypothetical protein